MARSDRWRSVPLTMQSLSVLLAAIAVATLIGAALLQWLERAT